MFIGHAPASYLWTRWLLKRWGTPLRFLSRRKAMIFGVCAGLLPDLDLIYFYLVDRRQHLHHGYWTHIPSFWVAVFSAALLLGLMLRRPPMVLVSIIAGSNVLLHLILDTVAGKVRWLFPLSRRDFVWVDIPAVHDWWVWNFILHWTFGLEVLLVIGALYVAYTKSGNEQAAGEAVS